MESNAWGLANCETTYLMKGAEIGDQTPLILYRLVVVSVISSTSPSLLDSRAASINPDPGTHSLAFVVVPCCGGNEDAAAAAGGGGSASKDKSFSKHRPLLLE